MERPSLTSVFAGPKVKRAEFEEREYETPLYSQLARGNLNVWAPGQVFEAHIGIDYALFMDDPWLFALHGFRRSPFGVVLSRLAWRGWRLRRNPGARLPTFRLNLFIQAKRPEWGHRPPRDIRAQGLASPFWRFSIDSAQQTTLEGLAARLGTRALVVYAAPVFHEHRVLFRHTRRGTITSASTFPSVSKLAGHERWYYASPGAAGVANPDARFLEEPPLEDRIRALVASEGPTGADADDSWLRNLLTVASAIHDAVSDERLPESALRAEYFNRLRELRADTEALEDGLAIGAFLGIALFCDLFFVQWYVLGGV